MPTTYIRCDYTNYKIQATFVKPWGTPNNSITFTLYRGNEAITERTFPEDAYIQDVHAWIVGVFPGIATCFTVYDLSDFFKAELR